MTVFVYNLFREFLKYSFVAYITDKMLALRAVYYTDLCAVSFKVLRNCLAYSVRSAGNDRYFIFKYYCTS